MMLRRGKFKVEDKGCVDGLGDPVDLADGSEGGRAFGEVQCLPKPSSPT
jgi:hypothetical protein